MSLGPWISERLFGIALLAYPRAFRRRFGDEMRDDFRRRAGRAPNGPRAFAALI
jgi:hypothetical protein